MSRIVKVAASHSGLIQYSTRWLRFLANFTNCLGLCTEDMIARALYKGYLEFLAFGVVTL
jgi:hypothetical protein